MLKYILLGLIMVIIAGAAIVRVRPIEPDDFHADNISDVVTSGQSGHFSAAEGGDISPLVIEGPLSSVAANIQSVIMRTPRTTLLAGNLTSENASATRRSASYVTRSRFFGFPDVTTVQLDATENENVRVSMQGRLVYGKADLGVNESRIRMWLSEIQPSS